MAPMTQTASKAPPLVVVMRSRRFIPVRSRDLVAALVKRGALAGKDENDAFERLWRVLASICHHEFFALLERLRDDYACFAPDADPRLRVDPAAQERAYADLVEKFEAVMRAAEFVEI